MPLSWQGDWLAERAELESVSIAFDIEFNLERLCESNQDRAVLVCNRVKKLPENAVNRPEMTWNSWPSSLK